MIAECFKNTTYHAVTTRVDFDTGLFLVGFRNVADGIGMDFAVFKFYTVGNVLHVVLRDWLVDPHVINFLLHIFRVSEFRGQFTVVSEQEYSGGVAVETSYRIDSLGASILNEVHNGKAAIGVILGCYAILRFVEQDVALAFKCHHLTLIFYSVGSGDLGTEFSNRSSVNENLTLLYQFIGFTTRAHTGICHEFVQTNLCCRVDSRHFIFNTLWAWSESHLLRLLLWLTVIVATTLTIVVTALAIVVATTLTIVVVTALAIVVVTALSIVVVAALTIVVVATALAIVVTTLAIVVVATLAVIVAALTIAIISLIVVATLAIVAVATLAIVVSALTIVASLVIVVVILIIPALTLTVVVWTF